jgi:DNA-binding LacI/PurR family transcriptional regulator
MPRSTKPAAKAVTAYAQIEGRIRHRLRQGDWSAGAMLPSRRDLAKEYGVSPITIDRAVTRLIGEGLLRADDRRGTFVAVDGGSATASLQAAPSELSFGQNRSNERVVAASTTIGIVASLYFDGSEHLELNNFWVRLILQSLEHAGSQDGRTTQFLNRVPSFGQPLMPLREAIARLLADGVDAITVVALGMDPKEVDDSLGVLENQNIPVVCITSGELSRPLPHLFYDNRSAGYQAAEHLLRNGHREILFFSPFMASWVKERLEGVQAAVQHAQLPTEVVRVFPRRSGPWVQEEDPEILGYLAAQAAFAEKLVHGSIMCVNDGVAFGFLKAAVERGLTAGEDFALVSFDDHPKARTAGLTTMRPPMEMIGKEAVRMLARALQGETTDLQVRMRSHLISRRSTRCVRSEGG